MFTRSISNIHDVTILGNKYRYISCTSIYYNTTRIIEFDKNLQDYINSYRGNKNTSKSIVRRYVMIYHNYYYYISI